MPLSPMRAGMSSENEVGMTTQTVTAQDLIVNALHQNRSPDEIVNEISGELHAARMAVGLVMKERALEARRLASTMRNDVSRDAKTHSMVIQDYYKKKDKWLYWRRKWGLPHTLNYDGQCTPNT